jgi:hypothetical protein
MVRRFAIRQCKLKASLQIHRNAVRYAQQNELQDVPFSKRECAPLLTCSGTVCWSTTFVPLGHTLEANMNGLIYLVGLIVVVMIILSFFRTALKEFRRWARARFAMNVDQSSPVIVGNNRLRYVQWGPVITGALLAGALAFVLNTIAVAIGLGVSSTAPT